MLSNLPHSKWVAAGKQVILKEDFDQIEDAILETFELASAPQLTWEDNTTARVEATADCPARVMLCGFPNVLHPGTFINAGLTDGKYRANTSNVNMILGTNSWGSEKASQWYCILADAQDADTTFALNAMPYMRVKSQAVQVISLGTNADPATGIGYGFTTDQFADGSKIYVLTGASKGLLRTILHNNNDNTTGGTIEYSGAALTLAQGDWFIILSADRNFRRLADIWNNGSSNFTEIHDRLFGKFPYALTTAGAGTWDTPLIPPDILVDIAGGGSDGGSASNPGPHGNPGEIKVRQRIAASALTPGKLETTAVGARGATGGTSSLGALLTANGGAVASGVPADGGGRVPLSGGLFGKYGNGGVGIDTSGTPGTNTNGTDGAIFIDKA